MCFEEMTSGHRLPKTHGKASGPLERPSARNIKEFTYTVKESGNVAGVDNDAEASKTFTVTVTDNGDGTLSVTSNPAQGALFSFTNTYSVDPEESSPTGEGGITITKNLTGRNLNEGEFTFELVDQSGTAVAMGTNDASGNVELGTVRFTEPGEFTYTVREANNGLGGVDYDAAQYKATAKVTDNGDGTLAVTWSFDMAAGDPASDIEFNNNVSLVFHELLKRFPGMEFCLHAHDHKLKEDDLFDDGIMYYGCSYMKDRNYLLFTLTPDWYGYEVVYY